MRDKIKIVVVIISIIVSLFMLRPAVTIADSCCYDFWSCAGAVLSGGVSCAIQNAVNTVNTIITSIKNLQANITTNVNNLINSAKQHINTAGSDLKSLVQIAKTDFDAALASARQMSASVMSQPPAQNGASIDAMLQKALPLATGEIEKIGPGLISNAGAVQQAAELAKNQVQNNVQAANKIVRDALLAPLDAALAILNNLLQHPENIYNPQALVDPIILSVTAKMGQTMTSVTNELISNANATLEIARMPAQQAMEQRDRARQINQAMAAASSQKTQDALNQLMGLLPNPPVQGSASGNTPGSTSTGTTGSSAGNIPAQGTGATANVSSGTTGTSAGNGPAPRTSPAIRGTVTRSISENPAYQKMTADTLLKTRAIHSQGQQLANQWKAQLETNLAEFNSKRQAVLNPVVPAGANESLMKHLDAMTTNQGGSQLDTTRSRLMEEARSRYSKDPKMLADFERMIGQDIDRRKTIILRGPKTAPR